MEKISWYIGSQLKPAPLQPKQKELVVNLIDPFIIRDEILFQQPFGC